MTTRYPPVRSSAEQAAERKMVVVPVIGNRPSTAFTFEQKLRCVSMTPLGRPVVPLVYIRADRSSGVTSANRVASPGCSASAFRCARPVCNASSHDSTCSGSPLVTAFVLAGRAHGNNPAKIGAFVKNFLGLALLNRGGYTKRPHRNPEESRLPDRRAGMCRGIR